MTYTELWRPLTALYDEGEAQAIARLVLETLFGLSLADVLCGQTGDDELLRQAQQRLLAGEPVQYVLGQAEFGPRTFRVAPGVLIPRPETYELCQWVVEETAARAAEDAFSILDIGTGSGCIACTLAAELPRAAVTAWDISAEALAIARDNATRLGVNVVFEQADILKPPLGRRTLATNGTQEISNLKSQISNLKPQISNLKSQTSNLKSQTSNLKSQTSNLIVSNPPYILQSEAATMEQHVLQHEPHQALFVPDDDPLLFYRAISDFALTALKPGGQLFLEINPHCADALCQLLQQKSYSVEQRRDQYGKTRFIKAQRP